MTFGAMRYQPNATLRFYEISLTLRPLLAKPLVSHGSEKK